jgi:zinc D-Ala-D-Ala carboxypeptidase
LTRRRKKSHTKLIFILAILLMLGLSAALVYQFVIKNSASNIITEEGLSAEIEKEEETIIPDEETKTDEVSSEGEEEPIEIADLEEEAADAAPFIEPDASLDSQGLIIIADGNDLLAPVNKQTTLKPDYEPEDLQPIPDYMAPPRAMQLREPALRKLIALWHTAGYDGVNLQVISAYRSYGYQAELFQRYAASHGEEEANRFSARPGQSEHQLGTTVDFGGSAFDLKAEFAETEQGRWLADNAHYFGFVMSYPRGSEDITGYIFEPWHYRYIGVENALEWKNSGLSLTEYLMKQSGYDY